MKIQTLVKKHMEQAEEVTFEEDGFLLWIPSPTKLIKYGEHVVTHVDKYPDDTWALTLDGEMTESVEDPNENFPFKVCVVVDG